MRHEFSGGTWYRRLGFCAGIAALAGCSGGESLGGTGGHAGGATGLGGSSGAGGAGGTAVGGSFGNTVNRDVDILMMIDDSSSMRTMQQKLYDQLPLFIQSLQSLSAPPSLHLAVVSSDLGAPGDSATSIGCTALGDQGEFHAAPEGTCTNSTLTSGDTFISDADMVPNYTDPLSKVVQCIALLGDRGCGFEHQLGSIDRALGADGHGPAPSQNAGFLRPEALLVILILTNEDDCSAPPDTTIFSLNGSQQNISNPDGPIANYRCNGGPRGGHLCQDPRAANPTAYLTPPLQPPSDAQMTATAPTLDLVNCQDNASGTSALTPVSRFVSDIKALKSEPDNQIIVATIAAPAAPYTVAWGAQAGGQNTQPGELWPNVMHSCGPVDFSYVSPAATQHPTDGSFGDPAVRITQFTSAFPNSVLGSICDASFAGTLGAVASKIGELTGN